jgi:hypothetical protein
VNRKKYLVVYSIYEEDMEYAVLNVARLSNTKIDKKVDELFKIYNGGRFRISLRETNIDLEEFQKDPLSLE